MITKFTFFDNYYKIAKFLPDEDRLALYDAIIKYMFEDEEPKLEGLVEGIWANIKMPLDTNKRNVKNGQNGGRPPKEENPSNNPDDNPKETQEEPKAKPKAKANNISYFLFLISNNKYNNIKYIDTNIESTNIIESTSNKDSIIIDKIKEWLQYKQEKKDKYTETGLKKLLNKIDKSIDEFGLDNVVEVIDYSMASNYQGIVFDRLKNKTNTYKTISQKNDEIFAKWEKEIEEEKKNE